MKPYNCGNLVISVKGRTGKGELCNGEVVWSGENVNHNKGVGFLLSTRAKDSLIGYRQVNSRIMVVRLKGQPLNLAVIRTYAPTTDNSDNKIDEF